MNLRFAMRKLIFILAAFSIGNLYADENGERREQLQEIREELRSRRSEYERLHEKEKDQIYRLRALEEQIALSGQLLVKIDRESNRLEQSIASQEEELNTANAVLEKKKNVLYDRIRYIYKVGNRPGWIELILSRNPTEAIVALKNMQAVIAYDRHLVQSYNQLTEDIESRISKLQGDIDILKDFTVEHERELRFRRTALDARRKILGRVRNDRSKIEKSIESLEEDAGQLAIILDGLQLQRAKETETADLPGLAGSKGDLIWPVHGKIIGTFGTRKNKLGIKMTNPGIDIKASVGASVKAAATGTVIYVSWLRGYGQFIILDHGKGYYTLYAHLYDIFVDTGDHVRPGEIIAEAGDTGSLAGPRLHFELRYRREQLNPLEWLR